MNDQHSLNNQHKLPSHLLFPGAKTALAVFTFTLDGITAAGRALVERAIAHPWLFGITAALIIGGVLFLTLPVIVGFAPIGPVEGSLAALWQSWIGNVVADSLFAIVQSLAMTGVFDTIGEAMIAAGVVGGGIGGRVPGSGASYNVGRGSGMM
ncbi:hypothetical protein Q9L58_008472, partial [Maublancomyces gigas]